MRSEVLVKGEEARVTVKSDAVDLSIPAPPPFNVAFPYGKAVCTIEAAS